MEENARVRVTVGGSAMYSRLTAVKITRLKEGNSQLSPHPPFLAKRKKSGQMKQKTKHMKRAPGKERNKTGERMNGSS